MGKLYLHIGCHKTGTTSIQRALFTHKELLSSHGYSYFTISPEGTSVRNCSSWIKFSKKNFENFGTGKIKQLSQLVNQLTKLSGDVIMSGEAFSWLMDPQDIMDLAEACKPHFSQVVIIIYIRRQDKLVISHYQQGSKKKNYPASFYYSSSYKALPSDWDQYDDYLNYNQKISYWENAFGKDNIAIRLFDKGELVGGDAVIDFFSFLGINEDVDTSQVNTSHGFEKTKVGHLINHSLPKGDLEKLLRRNSNNDGKLLPSSSDAQNFYSRFKESNKLLNLRYNLSSDSEHIFGDDFSSYPDEPGDVWDEVSANRAITNIFKAIEPLSNLKCDDLLDAATYFEKTDPEKAHRLQQAGNALKSSNKKHSPLYNKLFTGVRKIKRLI
ncbi:hypothetical protein [Amphritea balenae]|uniref:Sulfotransferase domain-containing protein n=1 Tax=Amphritea balenae TaxID=452629 RepID=A0A3P1SVU3_9GAMM|nr:hypothetical protein [Amphritea balenae]RRD01314.1 hypothetical protein EHS89_01765 [Amphritea balenae]GGK58232.1 hypothetical protein GCM10007941_05430 [Amphritea balenae]